MKLTASALRQNIYRVLDSVLATGVPVEIERKGRVLRIVADEPPTVLSRLEHRPDAIRGEPAELVDIDWTSAWSGADEA